MSNEFDDIQDLLAGILDDTKPLPKKAKAVKPPAPVAPVVPEDDFLNMEAIVAAPKTVISPAKPKSTPVVTSDEEIDWGELLETPRDNVVEVAAAIAVAKEVAPERDDDYGFDPDEDARLTAAMPKGKITIALDTSEAVSDDDLAAMASEVSKLDTSAAIEVDHQHVFTDSGEKSRIKIPVPTFTSKEMMAAFDMRNVATLATLQTNRWHAKVKDRQASRNAASVTGADANAFETRKRLLVGADELLVAIHKAIDAARIEHYAMTLPWSAKGMDDQGRRTGGRVLMNSLFFEYTQKMAYRTKEMNEALDAFEPAYPSLIVKAQKKLGGSFDPREYPNPSSIRGHFLLSFDFQPIPKGDDFMGLPQQQLDKLAAHLNGQTRTMLENAMQENWVRLHEVVEAMYERLSDPAKRFHGTLVENVREAVRLLTHLNITQDPRIETLRKYAEKHLCVCDAETLRQNPTTRGDVARHAKKVLDQMAKFAKTV